MSGALSMRHGDSLRYLRALKGGESSLSDELSMLFADFEDSEQWKTYPGLRPPKGGGESLSNQPKFKHNWFQAHAEKVGAFLHLQDDWDARGSKKPCERSIQIAVRLLYWIAFQPFDLPDADIEATPSGSLDFEMHSQEADLNIRIADDGVCRARYFSSEIESATKWKFALDDYEKLQQVLSELGQSNVREEYTALNFA